MQLQVGAVAAMLGGAAWLIKAVAILATGDQPPLLFEVAPALFAVGLLGLRAHVGPRPSTAGRAGGWFAGLALVLAVADLAFSPGEPGAFSALTFAAFLCVLASLVLLGAPVWRGGLLPGTVARLPLLLGVLTFPLLAAGGALEAVDERLLEVPLAILAVGWLWLGAALWRASQWGPPG